ncbi:MAG TPA: fimbria/pilus periplasmic chaperone [Rhizomicrobium sp.]|jgi:fimbrial chaperone protein
MRLAASCAGWAIAAAFLAAASSALAGSLEVAPTTLMLRQDGATGVLYVNNYGDTPVTVQVEPFDWNQSDGSDRLISSNALMVSPPIATIPAEGRQTVRVMVAPAAAAGERSFRLLISELPDSMKRAEHVIQVLTQFSVPVFAAGVGDGSGLAKPAWSATLSKGQLNLIARNDGPKHLKLTGLQLNTARGETLAIRGAGLSYVLAGSSRGWIASCARCTAGDTIHVGGSNETAGARFDESLVIGH